MSLWSRLFTRPTFDEGRWVVLDVESSGLDAARDRLLAIAAIAVTCDGGRPRIRLADSFEVVIRQGDTQVDKPTILLHGIGVGAQRTGVEPHEALQAFENWVGDAPLIAFHSIFDKTMIQRAMQRVLGHRLPNPCIDLVHVAGVAAPRVGARSLDEWLAHCGIVCAVRHQAAADKLATAELMLQLWPAIEAQGAPAGFTGQQQLAAQRRWLRSG